MPVFESFKSKTAKILSDTDFMELNLKIDVLKGGKNYKSHKMKKYLVNSIYKVQNNFI